MRNIWFVGASFAGPHYRGPTGGQRHAPTIGMSEYVGCWGLP